MDRSQYLYSALSTLEGYAASTLPRDVRAARAADAIRDAGAYRWVGLYDVSDDEIAVIAWSGPTAPTHPRFPRSQGVNGEAVATKASVIVQDVSKDARYLPTLADTRSEMIMPVGDHTGAIVGTIDVESAAVNAFGEKDQLLLEQCAKALRPLWDSRERGRGPTAG